MVVYPIRYYATLGRRNWASTMLAGSGIRLAELFPNPTVASATYTSKSSAASASSLAALKQGKLP